jgi:ABC-type sugar transport system substrate-binding protein/anti-anti-sigma regulatory factor
VTSPQIGCFIYTNSTFWSMLAHGLQSNAARFGANVMIRSARDVAGQDAILSDMISRRVDAIVMGVIDPEHGARSAQAAAAVNIPVVAVVAELPQSAARTTIRVDDIHGAGLAAHHLAQKLHQQGAIAQLRGPHTVRTARNRAAGFAGELAQYPNMRIVFEAEGQYWSFEDGQELMRRALAAHPEITGVFAASDGMALGALDTIAAAGRAGEITVIGFDGQPEGLAAIYDGRLAASVDQPSYDIGWAAGEAVERILRGEDVPAEITLASKLITAERLLETAMHTIRIMPGLFQSLLDSSEAQQRLQHDVIAAQRALIQELSVPILPLAHGIVAVPLVGSIDAQRAGRIAERILETVGRMQAHAVIVDISGVSVFDTEVANHLMRTAGAVQLLGASMILVGISPDIAQTIVQLGIDVSGLRTFSTLQTGLQYAQGGNI